MQRVARLEIGRKKWNVVFFFLCDIYKFGFRRDLSFLKVMESISTKNYFLREVLPKCSYRLKIICLLNKMIAF